MKIKLLLFINFIFTYISAQSVEEVIQAEKNFAAYSKDFNTKDAFLKFLDSNGIVFHQGNAYNAKIVFSNSKPSSYKLLWQPFFAGISISGELGFTTGPYEIRASLADTVSVGGAFSTIWHKTHEGEWKFLADMGIEFGKSPITITHVRKATQGNKSTYRNTVEAKTLDSLFIAAYNTDAHKAFTENIHEQACLNVKGAILKQGKERWAAIINNIPITLEMEPVNAGISKAGDMIWVYGNVKHEGKNENYLRVWQNTALGWKIVLLTLSW